MMKLIFLISLAWIFYSYIGYTALVTVLAAIRRRPVRWSDETPTVSLIVAAYNEERVIEEKVLNSLELDYPRDKLEILIASDCSSDRTDEIVSGYARLRRGVQLVRRPTRGGKTGALNQAIPKATGEVLVFSDANNFLPKDALRKLVRHFADPAVGCVGGEPRLKVPRESTVGKEVKSFWRYEQFLRKKESDFNTLIGVSGNLFAIRRELAEPLREDLIEDFVYPLMVAGRGYRVAYDPEAVAYEDTTLSGEQEYRRKVRVVWGGVVALWHMRALLNPFRYPLLSFQLFSHKICRWLTPFFLLTLFLSTVALMFQERAFVPLGLAMVAFAALSYLGYRFRNNEAIPRLFKAPYYFCLVNLAVVAGLYQFASGKSRVVWDPVRLQQPR